MKRDVIAQEITIDAPPDVVWRTLTEPDQIERWFVDRADLRAKPGYDGRFSFLARATHEPLSYEVRVVSVEPERRFSYRWMHPDGVAPDETNSMLVTFMLTPRGAGTQLRVVETGLDAIGWDDARQSDYAAEHNRGWTEKLGRMNDLITVGAP
jgi:uncharacterized protein YndB with AHSA1/START domain